VRLPIDDPEYWRKRAAEAREFAAQLTDPKSKEAMLRVAEGYDQLGDEARLPAWTGWTPN